MLTEDYCTDLLKEWTPEYVWWRQGYIDHGDKVWLLFEELMKNATIPSAQYKHSPVLIVLVTVSSDALCVHQVTLSKIYNKVKLKLQSLTNWRFSCLV